MAKNLFRSLYRSLPFKRPVLNLLRSRGASRWLSERLKSHLIFSGPFTVQLETTSFSMLHGYGREIEAAIFWDGVDAFEPTTIRWWCELSKRVLLI